MIRKFSPLVLLILLITFTGCSSTTSDNIKTSGMYALFTIEAKYGKESVDARASLQVGGITGSYIELIGDDAIYCDDVKLSIRKPGIGIIDYVGTLPSKKAGEKYVFKFKRKDEEHIIEVTQLQVVNIKRPVQSEIFKIGQDITVQWEPKSTENINLSLDGSCIEPVDKYFSTDNGEYVISGNAIIFDDTEDAKRCTANLYIKRWISSGVPSAFDGGNSFSYSIAEVDIQIEK